MKARFARKVVSLGERGNNRLKRMDGFPAPAQDPNAHIIYFVGMKLWF